MWQKDDTGEGSIHVCKVHGVGYSAIVHPATVRHVSMEHVQGAARLHYDPVSHRE